MSIEHLIFVGFNARVAALDRKTGVIVWQWKSPRPMTGGYVTLLLDDDRLVVSVNGYLYCLDPATGEEFWANDTKGFGTGVASLVSVRNPMTSHDVITKVAQLATHHAAAASATASRSLG